MEAQAPEVETRPDAVEAPKKEEAVAPRVFRDTEGKFARDPSKDALLERLSTAEFEKGKLTERVDQMQMQKSEEKLPPVAAGIDRDMLAAVQRATSEAAAAARELEEVKRNAAAQMDTASSKVSATEEELRRKIEELEDMKAQLAKSQSERDAFEQENREHRKRTREQLETHREDILAYIREVAGAKDCAMEQRIMDAIAAGDRNPEVSFMVAASAKHSEQSRDSKKLRTEYSELQQKWESMSGELQERRAAAPPLQTSSSRFVPEKVEVAPPPQRIEVGGHRMPESMNSSVWESMRTIVPTA